MRKGRLKVQGSKGPGEEDAARKRSSRVLCSLLVCRRSGCRSGVGQGLNLEESGIAGQADGGCAGRRRHQRPATLAAATTLEHPAEPAGAAMGSWVWGVAVALPARPLARATAERT